MKPGKQPQSERILPWARPPDTFVTIQRNWMRLQFKDHRGGTYYVLRGFRQDIFRMWIPDVWNGVE
jgi:hypothetical protein